MKLGFSGSLTRSFITSPLTPLLLIASLLVGAIALTALPREEEPQISVPMVDIVVMANGYKAADAVELITRPLEDIVKGIDGIEHVYSNTLDDRVVVTARFVVGTDQDTAILRVHEKIRAHISSLPIGIPEPLIVGRGINDVATIVLAISAIPEQVDNWTPNALYQIAEELQHELTKVDNVGTSYLVGGDKNQIRIEPDPERLSLYGVTLNQLVEKISSANRSFGVGSFLKNGQSVPVLAGSTLQGVPDIGLLLMTTRDGRPVYVKDVADVVVGAADPDHLAFTFTRAKDGSFVKRPIVSLAISKRKGSNAVVVADDIIHRLDIVRDKILPKGVEIEITRNYGETATEKANELLFHLALATVSIVILITMTIGWREGVVVLVIIPTTILLTLFASWLMGYTINRVSLFALIFSIGILVDDAIVVVENIVRHWAMKDERSRIEAAIHAVAEVGNPTIVATLTIVAALLPMMFVSGMMGPYMVAVTITPWLLMKVVGIKGRTKSAAHDYEHGHADDGGAMGAIYRRVARPLLEGRQNSKRFLIIVGVVTLASLTLFATKSVRVKLLPFDNKSEVQAVLDLPRGTSLEETDRTLTDAATLLKDLPELVSIQSYSGTSAPFNFNGLVRHYYYRSNPEQGDLAIRERLKALKLPDHSALKVVEVPPGPPVMSTLLAEIYGPTSEARRELAANVRKAFESVDFVVDTDDSFGLRAPRMRFEIDQQKLEYHGVEERVVYDTIGALIGGVRLGYSQRGGQQPIEIAIELPKRDLTFSEKILSTPLP
ncbi:MAG: efflux RND transporter permease subunit, partial [Alphaproteobacteria bacterium]|nr:efflux RND transporter permease subunit [Alphaproteobacteria bacterium]